MIFESVMSGIPIYQDIKNDPTLFIRKPNLHLICEDVCRDHYVISESTGNAILLEECLFWTEKQLISEGILDKVFSAVQGIYERIKEGIAKVITESSDAIKEFCEKIMNSKIVQAIRKKLGLDEKLSKEKFKQFIKVKNAKGEEVNQASEAALRKKGVVISEATKLSKKEEALTDPDEVQKYIDKYEAALSGEKVLKSKTGKPLSKGYLRDRLRLFENKLKSLSNSGEEAQKEDGSADNAESSGSSSGAESSGGGEEKPKSSKPVGKIIVDEGVSELPKNVGEEVTADDTVNDASRTAAEAEGGEEAVQELGGGEEKKKGLFDRAMNWAKDKIKSGIGAAKEWFAKQNKWVKYLIWGIIAVMAVFALWWVFTAFVIPIVTVIIHGSLAQSVGAVFTVVMSR